MIEVGKQVICIDDSFDPQSIDLIPNLPKKDVVYTVREIIEHHEVDAIGVLLEEISNPRLFYSYVTKDSTFEPSFSINRFVPLEWSENEEKTERANKKEEELCNLL